MYSTALSRVTIIYDTTTGLYSTSLPRRFVSHATSSSMVTSIPSTPSLSSALRRRASLLFADSPATSSGIISALPSGSEGRPSHSSTNGSLVTSNLIPFAASGALHALDSTTEHTVPSTATTSPAERFAHSHSTIDGVALSPSFINVYPVPSSDLPAASQ